MRIHLHIGAHRTATTYLQNRLAKSRALLSRRGVGIVPHVDLRRAVTNRLDVLDGFGGVGSPMARPVVGQALARLIAAEAGASLLILSDENLAGPIAGVEGGAGLYPTVGRRMSALLGLLKDHDVTMFLSVRSYAAFFESVYAYRSGQRRATDATVFRARALDLRRGWLEVAADICGAAGAERTIVWTYEAFARTPQAVSDVLTGAPGVAIFPASNRPDHPSLTRKGMQVLERASTLLGDAEYARFARVVARFPFDPPNEKFALFEAAEAARLDERYGADLAAIAELGCRVVDVDVAPADPARAAAAGAGS